jgi:large subunit ribosomal protein L3
MGHRRNSAPQRGSLGFRPRARAKRISGDWRAFSAPWVDEVYDNPTLCGFPGYKVGMSHVIKLEEKKRNKRFKQEVSSPVTVVEIPKSILFGIRVYKAESARSIQAFTEVWSNEINEDASRKIHLPGDDYDEEKVKSKISAIKNEMDQITEVRALVLTIPKEAGLAKKKPDILEIKIAGKDLAKNFDWAVDNLGKELNILDHFKSDEYIDVTSVSKGKGFAGPIKRHGVKILPRKTRKGRRVVGSVGSWHPARISWTTPRAGNMGFHNRTEYNKKILKIGENPREINPNAGWKNYGMVKSNYMIIEGSIPGASKRLVRVRKTVRKTPNQFPDAVPVSIQYVSLNFGQEEKSEEGEQ